MKRKVFASVLSALMVISSLSGVLMADVNETSVAEETEITVETEMSEETATEAEVTVADNQENEEENEAITDAETTTETSEESESIVTTEEDTEVVEAESNETDVSPNEVVEEAESDGTNPASRIEAEAINYDSPENGVSELDPMDISSPYSHMITITDTIKLKAIDTDNDGLEDFAEFIGTGELPDLNQAIFHYSYTKTLIIGEGITSIGNYNFYGCDRLENISLPSTLKRIGKYAFCECDRIKEIELPDGLTTIETHAFYCCEALESIDIPAGVKILPSYAFYECDNLKKVIVRGDLEAIEKMCFGACYTLKTVKLCSCSSIGDYAFENCPTLKSINVKEGLTYFGERAFYNDYSLRYINFPSTLNFIGKYAFYNTKLEEVVIPRSVTTLGESAFSSCKSLKVVKMHSNAETLEARLFEDCDSLEKVTLSDSVKCISSSVFKNCKALKELYIPGNVTDVDYDAFDNCAINLTASCVLEKTSLRLGKYRGIEEINYCHEFNHSSDTKCDKCGLVREVHVCTMDQFVERLYTTCLGRKSEAVGKEYWIKKLVSGTTGAEAAHQFFFSSEFTSKKLSDSEFITRLYKTFMDRNPDTNELNYWLGKIKGGYTREQVFQGFINSQEWADMCLQYGILSGGTKVSSIEKEPSKGCVEFITRLYTTCLGRKPDREGLNDWATKLTMLKVTGTKAAHGFFFSQEFQLKWYSNDEFIRRLYRTFMGREADSNGLKYWQDKFKSGYTREQVFQGFANSAEFEKICVQYGILK